MLKHKRYLLNKVANTGSLVITTGFIYSQCKRYDHRIHKWSKEEQILTSNRGNGKKILISLLCIIMNRIYFFLLYTSDMLFMLEKRKITLTVFTWKQHKKKTAWLYSLHYKKTWQFWGNILIVLDYWYQEPICLSLLHLSTIVSRCAKSRVLMPKG